MTCTFEKRAVQKNCENCEAMIFYFFGQKFREMKASDDFLIFFSVKKIREMKAVDFFTLD